MRLALVFLAACGTTIDPNNYAHDCDADTQCERVRVGDLCSCACNFSAINVRDDDKYFNDVERIGACRTTCTSDSSDPNDPDAGFVCGLGVGTRCMAGTCATYSLPADASAE